LQAQYILLVIFCGLGLPLPCFAQQMVYKSTEVTQITTPTFQGNLMARILKVKITTAGKTNPISLKELRFSTKGTSKVSDISNAQVIYTGTKDYISIPFPNPADVVGKVISKPTLNLYFSFNKTLAEGENYFWLVYDIGLNAMPGNAVDASFDSLFVAGNWEPSPVTFPVGNRKVQNYGQYCNSLISTPNTVFPNYIGITSVKFGSYINNYTLDEDDITLYASPRITTYRREQIPVEIKGGKGFDEQIVAWADWNNDGFFDSTEQIFYKNRLPKGESFISSFTIPCNATTGIHTIRIASDHYKEQKPEPCNNIAYGDIEDYLVEVFDDFSPHINFAADSVLYQDSKITINNLSDARGEVKYEWDFNNDGIYDQTAFNGTFTYTSTGWKKIRLKLTQTTCTTTKTIVYTDSVKIVFPKTKPVTDFISNVTLAGVNQPVFFTDLSSSQPNYWEWTILPDVINNKPAFTYVNGTTKRSQNPVVTFKSPGKYAVYLVTTNAVDTASEESKLAYITIGANVNMCAISDTIRETSGFIYDDGGKNSIYGINKKCFAVIKPPCAESIQITFNSFDVSPLSTKTGGDYLKVYDGIDKKAKSLHDSAGFTNGLQNPSPNNSSIIPPDLIAKSGAVLLEWHTDSAFIGDGFEAQWTTILRTATAPKASFISKNLVDERHKITFTNNSSGNELKYLWDINGDGIFDLTTRDAS
ncbi:MAG: hypothetical protein EOP53_18815, partial [Sphingobacteriales bacterium]